MAAGHGADTEAVQLNSFLSSESYSNNNSGQPLSGQDHSMQSVDANFANVSLASAQPGHLNAGNLSSGKGGKLMQHEQLAQPLQNNRPMPLSGLSSTNVSTSVP